MLRELSLRLFFVKKKQLEEHQIFLVVFFGASLTSLILPNILTRNVSYDGIPLIHGN